MNTSLAPVASGLFRQAGTAQCLAMARDFGHGSAVLGVLTVGLLAPLGEETVFRGFLYSWFRTRWSPTIAAVASSAVWAGLHLDLSLLLPLLGVGIILCSVYEKTRSIWPSALVHASLNLISLAIALNAPSC